MRQRILSTVTGGSSAVSSFLIVTIALGCSLILTNTSRAAVFWIGEFQRSITGDVDLSCPTCTNSYVSFANSGGISSAGGPFTVSGFPITTSSEPGGTGIVLSGEPRVSLTSEFWQDASSTQVTNTGSAAAIAYGTQPNGSTGDGSAFVQAEARTDGTFYLDSPYAVHLVANVELTGDSDRDHTAYVHLVGINGHFLDIGANEPGDSFEETLDALLDPGLYRIVGEAHVESTGSLPSDFSIQNQAYFHYSMSLTAVPAPAVGWLLAPAFGVLGWFKRRRLTST